MSAQTVPPSVDRGRVAWLLAGGAALVGGTLLGWNGTLLEAIATPPAVVRAALVGDERRGRRLADRPRGAAHGGGARRRVGELTSRDLAGLIRGVRYVFLAVAALSAGLGWLIGHPLPFIVALVIAGVDILETTFLLIVVTLRRDG